MNTLLFVTLIVLGLSGILLMMKKNNRLVAIFNVLFGTVMMQWAATQFNSEGAVAFHVLTAIVVLGYIVAQFLPKKAVFGALFSTILVGAAFISTGAVEMTLNEVTSKAETKFVIAAILMGSIAPFLIRLKLNVLKNWIEPLNPKAWTSAVFPLLAGVGFLLASLTAPVYGPMLVASAFLLNSFFDSNRSGLAATSLFTLAAVPLLVGEEMSPLLLNPDVIAGLLIGGFAVFLLRRLWSSKNNLVLIVIAYVLILGVSFAFAYTGSIFEQMGGFDTFIAILIGASLVQIIKGKNYQGISLLSPMLALGLVVPTFLVNEELEAAQNDIIKIGESTTDENGEVTEGPTVLPLKELSGTYAINEDASVVLFELGKEGGRTKGKFKKVAGSFNFTEDLSKASLNVTMQMKDFTTFNKMRDESLRGEEYFKVDKYPSMKFSGTGFTEKETNRYEVVGQFTMLGKTKEVVVSLQRVEVDDQIVLIGSGSLDRTEFGMTPSAAEGNVVDFNYQVSLSQK